MKLAGARAAALCARPDAALIGRPTGALLHCPDGGPVALGRPRPASLAGSAGLPRSQSLVKIP